MDWCPKNCHKSRLCSSVTSAAASIRASIPSPSGSPCLDEKIPTGQTLIGVPEPPHASLCACSAAPSSAVNRRRSPVSCAAGPPGLALPPLAAPSPPVSAGAFVVDRPNQMPQMPSASLTNGRRLAHPPVSGSAWIQSTASGDSFGTLAGGQLLARPESTPPLSSSTVSIDLAVPALAKRVEDADNLRLVQTRPSGPSLPAGCLAVAFPISCYLLQL